MQARTTIALGALYLTRGVAEQCAAGQLHAAEITVCLMRHARGDWGEVNDEDRRANDWSLVNGERLLSAYRIGDGVRVWIITERDRSSTTILFPSEY